MTELEMPKRKPKLVTFQNNATGDILEIYDDPNDITYRVISQDKNFLMLAKKDFDHADNLERRGTDNGGGGAAEGGTDTGGVDGANSGSE